jgi:nucleoside-diphosphate-sugar epimerase
VKVAITGATGFIGRPLVAHLAALGQRSIVLSRSPKRAAQLDFPAGTEISSGAAIPRCDALIHLAGESVAGLWTPAKRLRILASRVESTRRIVAELRAHEHKPHTMLVASAVGYYGDRPGELLTEDSAPDPNCGFRSEVCRAWEAAAQEAESLGIRVVRLRLGNVMSTDGGFLGGCSRCGVVASVFSSEIPRRRSPGYRERTRCALLHLPSSRSKPRAAKRRGPTRHHPADPGHEHRRPARTKRDRSRSSLAPSRRAGRVRHRPAR